MADNVAITAGSGTTIAADDIGGVLHQRVKLSLGADASATDAVGGAGAVSAAVQRNTLASDDPAVTALQVIDNFISGSRGLVTEDSAAAIKTAVELIDNAVSGAGFNVTQLGGAAVPIGAGTAAAAIRQTLASDDPAVAGIGGTADAAATAGSTGSLNAKERLMTSQLDSIKTAAELIDNAISGAGFNVTQLGGASVPIGAGTEAAAVRVTLPTNGTGIVGLATGTNAIGKLGANAGVTIGAVEIAAAQTLSTVTTVSTVTSVTAIANALPAGTNAIGKLAANSGVDIGDVDVLTVGTITPGTAASSLGKAEDGAHSSGDVGVMALAVAKATSVALGADSDYTPLQVDAWNRLHVRESLDHYETVAASQTGQALGATGATGDIISGILVIPATTSPGNVLLLDNATSITVFTGGASSVTTLHPFLIPLGIKSVSGAWKITTGANVSCIGMGVFT